MERRQYPSEMRAEQGEQPVLTGHAAVFDTLSVEMWGFSERIRPGAFTESLKRDDVRALWNHNTDKPLGRHSADTLQVWEDRTGLAMRIFPSMDTTYGRDAVASVARGDVSQMSFGFSVDDKGDAWEVDDGGELIRTIEEVRTTYEGSPVVFPAYTSTDVSVEGRSALVGSVDTRYEVAFLDLSQISLCKLETAVVDAVMDGCITTRTMEAVDKLAKVYPSLSDLARSLDKPSCRPRLMAAYGRIAETM